MLRFGGGARDGRAPCRAHRLGRESLRSEGCELTVDQRFLNDWARLRTEHTHDRDGFNNYGCFNVEACRNCNFVYNARGCLSCHNCDSIIECVQCVDCRDCAYSVGLNGARFHI